MRCPPPSADFAESIRLLLALHELFVRGQDASSEADAIRDAMDQPWYGMSDTEQHLVEQLSADLYTIGDRSIAARPCGDRWTAFGRARAAGEWMEALVLLQEHPGLAPPVQRALLRAEAWRSLGVVDASILFLNDALLAAEDPRPASTPSLPSRETPREGPRFPRLRRSAEAA